MVVGVELEVGSFPDDLADVVRIDLTFLARRPLSEELANLLGVFTRCLHDANQLILHDLAPTESAFGGKELLGLRLIHIAGRMMGDTTPNRRRLRLDRPHPYRFRHIDLDARPEPRILALCRHRPWL